VQADVAALLEEFEQYRKRLPPEPDSSWLVREAVALGHEVGVTLSTISIAAPQPYQQFTRLSVTLQLRASYHQLGTFLDHLERSDRYLHIDSVSISNRSHETSDLATIRLALSTVYLPPLRTVSGS
jgi:Tfp pilus assembly protein PilO